MDKKKDKKPEKAKIKIKVKGDPNQVKAAIKKIVK
jgi:hypothetical protein